MATLQPVWAALQLGYGNWKFIYYVPRLINRFQLGYFMRSLKVRQSGIQAYCYAAPGNTVDDDMVDQLCTFFEQFPAKSNPKAQPSLDPSSTLYGTSGLLAQGLDLIPDICLVIWLGINDCR